MIVNDYFYNKTKEKSDNNEKHGDKPLHSATTPPPPPPQNKINRIVVFDFDETIGYFSDLYILWNGYKEWMNYHHAPPEDAYTDDFFFYKMLDVFPEFFRPGIWEIFNYLVLKKKENQYKSFYIYTNNNCEENWVNLVVSYIHLRLNYELVNKIVWGHRSAPSASSQHKTKTRITSPRLKSYSDFMRRIESDGSLNSKTDLFFADDSFHKYMVHKRVYYIKPFPYRHSLSLETMIRRCYSLCNVCGEEGGGGHTTTEEWKKEQRKCRFHYDMNRKKFIEYMTGLFLEKTIPTAIRDTHDFRVFKEIMYHLCCFFEDNNIKNVSSSSSVGPAPAPALTSSHLTPTTRTTTPPPPPTHITTTPIPPIIIKHKVIFPTKHTLKKNHIYKNKNNETIKRTRGGR